MDKRAAAVVIHFLTASGSICGLLALHFAADHHWQAAFTCLGVAFVIDAIDGPLARWIDIEKVLPRFSGARLDEAVDYLNYCIVPAFIVMESGILSSALSILAGAAIVMSSLFHFADRSSKTDDGFFVGFPALWNIVVLYFFTFDLGPEAVIGLVLVFALLTLVPLKWPHPVRCKMLRPLTLFVVGVWALAAIYTLVDGFSDNSLIRGVFLACALYIIGLGLLRSFVGSREY